MARCRIPIFVAYALAAAALAACSGTSHSAADSGKPATLVATQGTGLVPVVACPTTRGAPGATGDPYPTQLALSSDSTAVAQRLAYYSDDAKLLTPVLGPRGWHCSVEIGADGGSTISVFPDGATAEGATKVFGQVEPACQGCVWSMVCAYIPAAQHQIGSGLGTCPATQTFTVSEETPATRTPGEENVLIELGSPSEPPFASGALLYRWKRGTGAAAALETCQLPLADATLCNPIVSDFQDRNETAY